MPIARAIPIGTTRIPGALADGDIRANAAVAVINDGSSILIVECSNSSNANQFIGFAVSSVSSGEPVSVHSARGSVVSPILKDGDPLNLNEPVFLSGILGEVTSGPVPPTHGVVVFQVGLALSSNQLTLNTDAKTSIG